MIFIAIYTAIVCAIVVTNYSLQHMFIFNDLSKLILQVFKILIHLIINIRKQN
jgi:hypothetical protein